MTLIDERSPAEIDGLTDGVAVARAEHLSKVYGTGGAQVVALDDVTVEFGRGRLTAIMGPSGSGKSTLMHCMAALDAPTSGHVVIDGVDVRGLKDKALTLLRRDRLGFVFQAYNLVPTLTARENITLPVDIAGVKLDVAWFDTVVDALGIRDRLSHRPEELSGGQQQRVACARALVRRPAIVFADEPTGNLDTRASSEILAFLRHSVDDFGQSIVMVTHDPVAASYADRVLFLVDGRIVDEILASRTSWSRLEPSTTGSLRVGWRRCGSLPREQSAQPKSMTSSPTCARSTDVGRGCNRSSTAPDFPDRGVASALDGRRHASIAVIGLGVDERLRLLEQLLKRRIPLWQVHRQCDPGSFTVDLVVLMDQEVAVRHRRRPPDAVGREHVELREAVGCFAEFHHQRVAGFLQEVIVEIGVLTPGEDLVDALQPALDVEQLLGGPAIHHSSTASRRMSSSRWGLSPP